MKKYIPAALCASLILGTAVQSFAAAEPYIPTSDNQLLCLGATKQNRFTYSRDSLSWPTQVGEAEICLWKDDKFAAVSITIDDNWKPDHAWWLANAEKYGFKLTWFIISDRIGDNPDFNGTWADYQRILDAGHAVESHTANHLDAKKNPEDKVRVSYEKSIRTIEENLPGHKVTCLAFPNGSANEKVASEYFIAVRGVNGEPNPPAKINWANTRMGNSSPDHIDSVLTGTAKKTKWLNNKGYMRGWMPCLFHGVPNKDKVQKSLDYMGTKTDVIWFGSFPEVARYGQERDSATMTVSPTKDGYAITITDKMRDDLFAFPLTVKVNVPTDWTAATVTQSGKTAAAKLIEHEGAKFALIDVVPDKGAALLQKK